MYVKIRNSLALKKNKTKRPALCCNAQYLTFSHVNASDMTLLPHQLAQHVAIPPTSATQVQDPAALQALRHHQATAIVPEGRGHVGSVCEIT